MLINQALKDFRLQTLIVDSLKHKKNYKKNSKQ